MRTFNATKKPIFAHCQTVLGVCFKNTHLSIAKLKKRVSAHAMVLTP